MNTYSRLIQEPENSIEYHKRNSHKYFFYYMIFIVSIGFLLNLIVYFYYFPKQIADFRSSVGSITGDLDLIKKYGDDINDMKNKSLEIYNIVESICKNSPLSIYCK